MSSGSDRNSVHWLEDIVDWAARLGTHIQGFDEEKFRADAKSQDAVIRCLECIGLAARKALENKDALGLSDSERDFLNAYWMRNRLAHGYYDVDLTIVWDTALDSVPELVRRVQAIREKLPRHNG